MSDSIDAALQYMVDNLTDRRAADPLAVVEHLKKELEHFKAGKDYSDKRYAMIMADKTDLRQENDRLKEVLTRLIKDAKDGLREIE